MIAPVPENEKLIIRVEAYPQKIKVNHNEFFDYNRYYDNIINEFNKNRVIVERVQFDEY